MIWLRKFQSSPKCRMWHGCCWFLSSILIVRIKGKRPNKKIWETYILSHKEPHINLESKEVSLLYKSAPLKRNRVFPTGTGRKMPWEHLGSQQDLTHWRMHGAKQWTFLLGKRVPGMPASEGPPIELFSRIPFAVLYHPCHRGYCSCDPNRPGYGSHLAVDLVVIHMMLVLLACRTQELWSWRDFHSDFRGWPGKSGKELLRG